MPGPFEGKEVVITGAAGVYGTEIAQAFAGAGATLCLSDRRADALERLASDLDPTGAGVMTHATDLLSDASIADLVAMVASSWGAPDIVINNAGIYPFGELLEIDVGHWDAIIDTNLRAPFLVMQGFCRLMLAGGRTGSFVNISSGAADVMRTNDVPYCVSKRGLEWLSQGFALSLARSGIRVNCVQAGLAPGSATNAMPRAHAEAMAAQNPMARNSRPGDLANAVMFLASEAASYITGHSIAANGGGSIPHRVGLAGATAGDFKGHE